MVAHFYKLAWLQLFGVDIVNWITPLHVSVVVIATVIATDIGVTLSTVLKTVRMFCLMILQQ